MTAESVAAAESSDVVMLLGSPASLGYFSVSNIDALVQRTRLVLVLVRPVQLLGWGPVKVQLPRDAEPLLARRDRREGLLDVIRGLQEIVAFRPEENPAALSKSTPSEAAVGLSINEIGHRVEQRARSRLPVGEAREPAVEHVEDPASA